jgi:xanthine dehydrogenase YagS FAD-binding subunit
LIYEIVTEIQVSLPAPGTGSKFIKFALRKSIDYPIINCAAVIQNENGIVKAARICLNAVYNKPYRATAAEKAIINKKIDEKTAEIAGEEAVTNNCPLPASSYKVKIARTLVSRVILACKNTG